MLENFAKIAELRIREAIERGELENLPGAVSQLLLIVCSLYRKKTA